MENLNFLSVILLSVIVISHARIPENPYLNLERSNLPSVQAGKMIRELNLFPKSEVNVIDGGDDGVGAISESGYNKRIVERKFRFPNVVGDEEESFTVDDLGHHAGYYNIEHSHDARMFYFFFESRTSKKDPVVIWLTGGPGCSSELAMFYENGPYTIANNLSLVRNEYGWDKVSNLLYVDQPTGTGYSYSSDRRDIRHNEGGVSNDLYDFLQAFFEEHPELAENDFYITGESYAGHYIPAFAARVHKGNKAKEGIHVNLKGFAIGNGLTDPAIQYKAYTDYALDMGIIKQAEHDRINKIVPVCEVAIKLCGTDGTVSCLASYLVCNTIFSSILSVAGNINYYDVRKKCEGSLCYDFSNMEKFLGQKSVKEALGVGDIDFVSCSTTVYMAMLTDWMRNLEVGIPALLEDGVKLLVYAGEYDLICNWLGNSRWVHAMEWYGQKEFVASPEVPFEVSGSEAGVLKSYGPLAFLKVHNAGHMVPMDQPEASLEMLKRWTQGKLSEVTQEPQQLVAEM
uniref:Carboxypeptidase n=1 Tax=Populus tomentosa TaxID=118781 RepID=A0A1X9IUH7_POPTO|nr:Serine carboxypeptidase precursor family protein [Populus tomentosa]